MKYRIKAIAERLYMVERREGYFPFYTWFGVKDYRPGKYSGYRTDVEGALELIEYDKERWAERKRRKELDEEFCRKNKTIYVP